MSPVGAKPQPAHLHVMAGTARPEHGESAPSEVVGLPVEPPVHLGSDGRRFWTWGRAQLTVLRLCDDGVRVDLERMAELYERKCLATAAMPESGFYICARSKNPKRHPASVEAMQAGKELRLMMEACGLSVIGRTRMAREGVAEDDPLAEFGL